MSDKEVQVAEQAAPEIQLPLQRTLALIKPDAVKSGKQQPIIDAIRLAGFHIADERSLTLSLEEARLFYREHEGKPFYTELTEWMSGGPIYAMVLEKANAIQDWRALMGPTDPARARETEPNSIRARFGADGMSNATHGSDCQTSAEREINLLFSKDDATSASLQQNNETTQAPAEHNESVIEATKSDILDAKSDLPVVEDTSSESETVPLGTPVVENESKLDPEQSKAGAMGEKEDEKHESVKEEKEEHASVDAEAQEEEGNHGLVAKDITQIDESEKANEPAHTDKAQIAAEEQVKETNDDSVKHDGLAPETKGDAISDDIPSELKVTPPDSEAAVEERLNDEPEIVSETKSEYLPGNENKNTDEEVHKQAPIAEKEQTDAQAPVKQETVLENPEKVDVCALGGTDKEANVHDQVEQPTKKEKIQDVDALETAKPETSHVETIPVEAVDGPIEKETEDLSEEQLKADHQVKTQDEAAAEEQIEAENEHKAEEEQTVEEEQKIEQKPNVHEHSKVQKGAEVEEKSNVEEQSKIEASAAVEGVPEDSIKESAAKEDKADPATKSEEAQESNEERAVEANGTASEPTKIEGTVPAAMNDEATKTEEPMKIEEPTKAKDDVEDLSIREVKDQSAQEMTEVNDEKEVKTDEGEKGSTEPAAARALVQAANTSAEDKAQKPKATEVKETKPTSPSRSPPREKNTKAPLRKPATTTPRTAATAASTAKPATATAAAKRSSLTAAKKAAGTTTTPAAAAPRVPRVAGLAKKPTVAKEEPAKPTTATTARKTSTLSRLTAPTAASARKQGEAAITPASAAATPARRSATATARSSVGAATRTTTATASPPKRTSPSSTAEKKTTTVRKPATTATTAAGKTSAAASGATPTKRVVRRVPAAGAEGATAVRKTATTAAAIKKPATGTTTAAARGKTAARTTAAAKRSSTSPKSSSPKSPPSPKASASPEAATASEKESKEEVKPNGKEEEVVEAPPKVQIEQVSKEEEVPSKSSSTSSGIQIAVEAGDTEAVDNEVAATVGQPEVAKGQKNLSSSLSSTSSRPLTPEVAQLRNKFEQGRQEESNAVSSNTMDARARSPSNRVKDMINKFAG